MRGPAQQDGGGAHLKVKHRSARRAAAWLIVLTTTTLCVSATPSGADQASDVAAECRRFAQSLGLTTPGINDAIDRATPDELARIRQACKSAYPERSADPAAVQRGLGVYTAYGCGACHGKDGRGGESGPSLMRSQRVMRDKNGETIGEVVLNGVPNTRMVGFPLKPGELSDLAAYLHSAQASSGEASAPAPSIVTGNATAGRKYFERNCSECHSIATDSKQAAATDPRQLQQNWLMPKRTLAVTASVMSPSGTNIDGRLLRIDEFRVTLGFADGTERTFERTGEVPTVTVRDPLDGHRSLLPKYADQDIHNVTAYLVALRNSRRGLTTVSASSPRAPASLSGDNTGLPPEAILNPVIGSWPTYSGDYSGRRYSPLTQINQSNVQQLTLAWATRLVAGPNGSRPLITAGEGKGDLFTSEPARVCGSVLAVNGMLYVSSADNAWAVNAHDGRIVWHFNWKTRGGWRFCNRGLGMWGQYLYLETPDDYLVSLDSRTGHERWHVEIASFEEQYFASTAPVVIGNNVLVGVGNTLNTPGFLQSFDAETGKLRWKRYSVPMNPGDPGLDTWKDLDAAKHGGGQVWIPGSYDPETRLYIYGTGNPTPTYVAELRGNGAALFTCSLIAVDIDTGKMAWYYQTSPNDTHDWDSAQTPVLADITINDRLRKVAMTAARNGYFFVVDRTTGEHVLTSKFSNTANWAEPRLNAKGHPVRIAAKDSHVSGALVSNANEGAINWQPASYSPDFGLFYVPVAESWAMYYKTATDAQGAYAMVGKEELSVDADSYLKAIDPRSGKIVWSVKYPSRGLLANGVLTTSGKLLFSGDTAGNLVARDPANGRPLWRAQLGAISNAPQTYMLEGRQYVLVAAGDTLYAFRLQS